MNFQLTEEQKLIQKTAREFADAELAPGAIERDEKKISRKKSRRRSRKGSRKRKSRKNMMGGAMESSAIKVIYHHQTLK